MAMETLMHNTEPLGALLGDASDIVFDNSGTSLTSDNVEDAIKELTDADNIAYDSNNSVKEAIDEKPTDISDKFVLNTTQFSTLSGNCKAFYDKKTKRVWGSLSAGASENIGQTQAYFTIASEYRPSANITDIPMQVRMSDDRMLCYFGNITTGGLVRQDLTSASRGIYAYFEYYL